MQAVTKVMPVFFGLISYGFNSATTIYFVVSNVWRIGQQHFVLNKMYEEEHGRPAAPGPSASLRRHRRPERQAPDRGAGSANGIAEAPSPNAARRKKKKRKR